MSERPRCLVLIKPDTTGKKPNWLEVTGETPEGLNVRNDAFPEKTFVPRSELPNYETV